MSGGLLPTPTASLGDGRGGQSPERRKAGNHAVNLKDMVEKGVVGLLPTPNTMDMLPPHAGLNALRASGRGGFVNLRDEAGPEGGVRLTTFAFAPAGAKANLAVTVKDGIGFKEDGLTNNRFEGSDSGFMPTPRARDVKGHNQRRNQDCLEGAAAFGMDVEYLPTPTTFDEASERMASSQWRLGGSRAMGLPRAVRTVMGGRLPDGTVPDVPAGPCRTVDWGRFAPAIRRWERIMGRPAPCPTETTGALRRWLADKAEPQWLDPSWLKRHAPRADGSYHLDQPMRERMMACWRGMSDGTDLLAPFWRHVGSFDPDEPIPSTLLPARCVTDYWDDMRHARWRSARERRGAYRPLTLAHLSPKLSEWMMGLPDGWITSPDIWRNVDGNHRNMMLKLAGNGVVPQQGAVALRWALEVRARLSGTQGE